MDPTPRGDVLVVMGVAGAGKTTVGSALAARLGLPYADADDLHPAANVAKMRAGVPLDDEDRRPWLEAVGGWLAGRPAGGVVSCSALRRHYRDTLRAHEPRVRFLHLAGSPTVVAQRVAARTDHFMPPSLVASQLALLEPLAGDEDGLTVPLDWPVDRIVTHLTAALRPTALGAVS
ncbi:MAG: gluconokinase [Nocardioides sp.]